MSKIIDKRKRSREEDVLCESTPLSKRINNLHLTNFEEVHVHQVKDVLISEKILFCDPTVKTPNKVQPQHSSEDLRAATMEIEQQTYNPELNETQNPFYYVKNKLLHDLHLERIKRCHV